ncbi:hypothetical protein Q3G72_012563 [Acer saccharum]|nr:hypothetical protein Q3G72_010801 [Acer saccharum]KAK1559261.1 hypothetical protein Q3G72_012563 [Acer saccharum]
MHHSFLHVGISTTSFQNLRAYSRSPISELLKRPDIFQNILSWELCQGELRIGLRLWIASSDSHIAISQLADSYQKGLRLWFRKLARMYSQFVLAVSSTDPTATSDWKSVSLYSQYLLAASSAFLIYP